MKSYSPTEKFITPPENQGQIVTCSYSLDADAEVIIENIYDASDRTQIYRAYAYPRNDDGTWEPWNGVPELGRSFGECQIRDTEEEEA